MGGNRTIVKKAKQQEVKEGRWPADADELNMVAGELEKAGLTGKELKSLAQHTYTAVRVGNFSSRTLIVILTKKVERMGTLDVSQDDIENDVGDIAEWATKVAEC